MGTSRRQGRNSVRTLAKATIGIGAAAAWCLIMAAVLNVVTAWWQFCGALVLVTVLVVAAAVGVMKLISA